MRKLAVVGTIIVGLSISLGMHGGALDERGVIRQPKPMEESADIELNVSVDHCDYSLDDGISIDVTLLNTGSEPVYLLAFLGYGYRSSLVFRVLDADGNELERPGNDDSPPFFDYGKERLVWLFPGHYFGARRTHADLRELGITEPGTYSIVVDFSTPLSEKKVALHDLEDGAQVWTTESGGFSSEPVKIIVGPSE